jgi:hypothetical protein
MFTKELSGGLQILDRKAPKKLYRVYKLHGRLRSFKYQGL